MPRPVPKKLSRAEREMTLSVLRRLPRSGSEYTAEELVRDAEYERLAIRKALEARKSAWLAGIVQGK